MTYLSNSLSRTMRANVRYPRHEYIFQWEVLLFGFSLGVLVTMTLIASYVLYNF